MVGTVLDADAEALPAEEVQARVKEYSDFKDNVLRRDLRLLEEKRTGLESDLKELKELEKNVAALVEDGKKEFETSMDIGCQVFVKARVPDTSRLFVHAGLGFHVECLLDEVPRITALRKEALEARLSETNDKLRQVEEAVAMAESHLHELAQTQT